MNEMSAVELRMVQWLTPMMFLLGSCAAALLVIFFNLRTNRIVKEIQRLEGSEGRTWAFWSDQRRLLAFVFRPATLINVADGQPTVIAKRVLIAHRQTLKKRVLQGLGFLLLGFAAGIAVPITIALLHHRAGG